MVLEGLGPPRMAETTVGGVIDIKIGDYAPLGIQVDVDMSQ